MSNPYTTKSAPLSLKPRRTYNKEFKLEAVKLAESIGQSPTANELGIDRSLLSAWRKSLANEGKDAFRGSCLLGF